jgi:hypothetical protein
MARDGGAGTTMKSLSASSPARAIMDPSANSSDRTDMSNCTQCPRYLNLLLAAAPPPTSSPSPVPGVAAAPPPPPARPPPLHSVFATRASACLYRMLPPICSQNSKPFVTSRALCCLIPRSLSPPTRPEPSHLCSEIVPYIVGEDAEHLHLRHAYDLALTQQCQHWFTWSWLLILSLVTDALGHHN